MSLRFILGLSITLNVILVFSLVWGQQGIMEYKRLYNQSETLKERIFLLKTQNAALSREIRLLQSDEKYVEKMIRNRLHFIRDNEIRYIFSDETMKEPLGAMPHETKN